MKNVKVTVTPDRTYVHYDGHTWAVDDKGFLKVYKRENGRTVLVASYNPRFWVGVTLV